MITLPAQETDLLRHLAVRLLQEHERPEFDRLIGEKHYPHNSILTGQSLRYVAELDGQPLQLLSAVTRQLRLTIARIPIEETSNEIPVLAPLLARAKPPPGALIDADAMRCQQESARLVTREWGGDCLFGLKGNQSGILEKAQRRHAGALRGEACGRLPRLRHAIPKTR